MSLITETLLGVEDKVALSIEALRTFEPPEGYFVAFSGGKDSVVIKKLCDLAGVKYDAHYNVTSVDPPELVRFIKDQYPDVSIDIPHDKYGKPVTMWSLIAKNTMPPTQIARYCCEYLKETGGIGRFTVTGVRWAESNNRKTNQGLVTVVNPDKEVREHASFLNRSGGGVFLNSDNTEARQVLESCYKRRKTLLNPIINWEDEDVWEFIHKYDVPYCKLYDQGYTRIGCIGCPMASQERRLAELERYPKYKQNYIRAFEKMLANKRAKSGTKDVFWETGEDVMEWWVLGKGRKNQQLEGQIEMIFEEE